ncbi:formyltetrahydrofolate deformylase [Altererythrobacter sp. FM1]|uniref:Formyltetrahydrofolate deformylase n=1 Tax=Tsuneonella flava TaxID=2055955 RepID=A0ABX7K9D6_9SPHN|nr:formyltetrahydrofolate deformylase [Tsuneonella flava]QSB44582.1 formyltetrahydrofolate deformylase [Tsuneonella flava]ROT93853.1 formyltetrahydrofolate deformylase [Altererythrobacter sp. FM1]UBS33013.1 formyltetrahydrofolate deformylase [Altererythrobacter sp. N1]
MDNSCEDKSYILALSCKDQVGIVAAVSAHLAAHDGFILDSQQYADLALGSFFMRVEFAGAGPAFPDRIEQLRDGFAPVAAQYGMRWELVAAAERPRVLVAVSKGSHCLNDLLHRWRTGNLPVDIVGVVSNHPDLRDLTEWHGIAFHHLPIGPDGKDAQEQKILALHEELRADYLVLARYMQVLSSTTVDRLAGKCINIHHSFLPSFKGARPYHQAHSQGVKLIGATAHFVTSDLDEGPIIEQDVERVDHRATQDDLVRIGRDIEARVLARAVRWVAERRVFLNGVRTVVFR